MITYQDFLNRFVISEKDFNKIINSIPDIDFDTFSLSLIEDPSNNFDVAYGLIESIVGEYGFVIDTISLENKEISVYDEYGDTEYGDIDKLRNRFSGWRIIEIETFETKLYE